jgi:hypothetical protein
MRNKQMQVDGQIKKELMAQQFGYDQQLKKWILNKCQLKKKILKIVKIKELKYKQLNKVK